MPCISTNTVSLPFPSSLLSHSVSTTEDQNNPAILKTLCTACKETEKKNKIPAWQQEGGRVELVEQHWSFSLPCIPLNNIIHPILKSCWLYWVNPLRTGGTWGFKFSLPHTVSEVSDSEYQKRLFEVGCFETLGKVIGMCYQPAVSFRFFTINRTQWWRKKRK